MAVYDPELPTMAQITDLHHEILMGIVELNEADTAVRHTAAGLALNTLATKLAKYALELRAGYEFAEQRNQTNIV